ncbi:TPA: phage tail protein [Photobacterium damselae]
MSSNTTSKVITTKAGEALIAQMQAENKVLVIDKFIFANVPNRPDFPQREDVLPTEHVVHESAVHEQGRMTENSVIYSTTLASNVGPFTFNWSGLYCSEHNTLVAINFPAAVDKTVDGPGVTGNTLVRSFVLEYKGIAETTNITVDPASWQYDAHKRMSKMDNDSAQAIIDQNGKDWFIDDGFIVTPQSTAYNIKAGAGYVSGHRITLDFDRIVQAPIKPSFIYVDAYREGSPTGEWVTKFNFVVSPDEKDDYTDAQGVQHFVCQIAQVMEDGSVGDMRPESEPEKAVANKKYQIWVNGDLRNNSERFKDRPDIREYQNLVSDGLWNDAIDTALRESTTVLMPNKKFDVSDTVRLNGRGFGLQGYSKNARNYGNSTFKLCWRGGNQPRKAVVLIGQNEVGAEPIIDATDNVLSNVFIDCGDEKSGGRAGFGVYGTYLTNETLLDRISVLGSSEYNYYIARSWYAAFKNLISLGCKNNGIALGMPLCYADGELVKWSTAAPLELNNTDIYNLRSHGAGQRFSLDAPGTFNPMDLNMTRQGYGVGLGIGNSFQAEKITSEGSGGFNLYSFTSSQPLKTIKGLYLEGPMKNSGLDPATELGNILFEADNATGGAIEVTDVFSNYHGGGIYLLGEKRPMRLKNVHQPRFLKSIDGLSRFEVDSFVYRENCYHGLGYHTTEDRTVIADEVHNIRYSWAIDIPFDPTVLTGGGNGHPMYYVAIKANGEDPGPSTFVIEYEDGTTTSYNYPNPLPAEWTHFARVEGSAVKIRRGGNASDKNVNVRFNIVKMNPSYV